MQKMPKSPEKTLRMPKRKKYVINGRALVSMNHFFDEMERAFNLDRGEESSRTVWVDRPIEYLNGWGRSLEALDNALRGEKDGGKITLPCDIVIEASHYASAELGSNWIDIMAVFLADARQKDGVVVLLKEEPKKKKLDHEW